MMNKNSDIYTYTMTQSVCRTQTDRKTVYGIALSTCKNAIPGAQIRFPDLATDRRRVQTLVDLCNRLQLDPIHLKDVAEDFLFVDLCKDPITDRFLGII